ncbi:MAG: outer membrane lipoprotein carrier protein LolA [Chitinophagales bacterium]
MTKLYTCLWITLSLFFIGESTVQGQDRKIENDPEAKVILDKVSKKYRSFKSLKVEFKLSMESAEGDLNESYNGSAIIKDEKYRLETDQLIVICDNVKRWTYLKDSKELQINFYEPDPENIESPAQLFTIYEKDFYYRLLEENNGVAKIELIPQDISESPFERIHLFVNTAKSEIEKAQIRNKDKVEFTWQIETFNPNLELDEGQVFAFDNSKHEVVHEEDLTK